MSQTNLLIFTPKLLPIGVNVAVIFCDVSDVSVIWACTNQRKGARARHFIDIVDEGVKLNPPGAIKVIFPFLFKTLGDLRR